jgi:hypothetical protein
MDENVGSGKRGEQDKYTISVQQMLAMVCIYMNFCPFSL